MTAKGHSQTTLIKICPFLTTHLSLIDICEGISLLLHTNIWIPVPRPATYLSTLSCQRSLWTPPNLQQSPVHYKPPMISQNVPQNASTLHTVSFDWFLSGLEWILNLDFCLLKLLIIYQKWDNRSRLNPSTFWVFRPVFR